MSDWRDSAVGAAEGGPGIEGAVGAVVGVSVGAVVGTNVGECETVGAVVGVSVGAAVGISVGLQCVGVATGGPS
jgi:hypothetical protein